MNKSKVTMIGASLLFIFVLLFYINSKHIGEYKFTSSYYLSESMHSMNFAALNIINHVDGSHEFTVRELLDIYEEEAKLIDAYAHISYSLKLEENSNILNPNQLYMLVPLNNTDWWNDKEENEFVMLNETEYHSMNKLLHLSKIVNNTFKDLGITNVEETTPTVATKLLLGITKEYPY